MSLVVVEKFNFIDMLKSIGRYRISHLMLARIVSTMMMPKLSPFLQACPSAYRAVLQGVLSISLARTLTKSRWQQSEILKNYTLSSVRSIMVGAAPLSNEVNEQIFRVFPEAHIGQAYGALISRSLPSAKLKNIGT